jgi:tagatose 6-phosphate kinase
MADSLYPELLRAAARGGIPTLLDTYGEALRLGLQASPTVVKINRQEAAAWLGRPLDTLRQQVGGLGELLRTGPEWAVLTLGEGGALLAQGRQRWIARPPEAAVVNPISSGDAMTAGLMMGIVDGQPSQECFRLGMAMAVVNAMTWDVCRLTPEEVQAMLPQVELTPA